ncbi:adenosylmethionine decarboxylase [Malassezia yamatoensis]|uniref:adenosylmethionine decarboxylase n=1 Tax=Malassezia yamatoensis TaxID=253288 RepID=A0AAJ6CIE2_9BASI|nr:adenosylmethionine decarboxylase [Malassezia yamatoensis]
MDLEASAVAAEAQWDDADASHIDMGDLAGPFEGPEKLLELWFASSVMALPECEGVDLHGGPLGRIGLRRVPRSSWENMLELVHCKTLSVESNSEMDAYLLSESSMFIYPHKIILKTCGTTTLLLGLERLLQIAKTALFDDDSIQYGSSVSSTTIAEAIHQDFDPKILGSHVHRCFYSRKSFMFPEKQKGPHRDWMLETEFLDRFFDQGAAYTVGKMNGDHWLLYMAANDTKEPVRASGTDMTLELLMTDLSKKGRNHFTFDTLPDGRTVLPTGQAPNVSAALDHGHALGKQLSTQLQLHTLFPQTQLDAFGFDPCGYSANALVPATPLRSAGYWTVHVTPEEGSSYASFETNMALDLDMPDEEENQNTYVTHLQSLVERIVDIFEPGSFTMTLFVSAGSGDPTPAFALRHYRQSDRILYEFEGYYLLYLSFEQRKPHDT